MSDIMLDKGDVSVEEAFDECGECTTTLTGSRWIVAIDFRSAGMTERLGPYCWACAEHIAERIKVGLPAPPAAQEGR